MALVLVSAPAVEPVSLAEAKNHLRVDTSADDALIGGLITAARETVETLCRPQVAMITQTWAYVADGIPDGDTLELRPYPLQSVESIAATDDAGLATTFGTANYLVDTTSEPGRVRLRTNCTWPSTTLQEMSGFRATFVAGFGTAGTCVPQALRQAVLMLVGHLYENRESVIVGQGFTATNVPFSVLALTGPWRRELA